MKIHVLLGLAGMLLSTALALRASALSAAVPRAAAQEDGRREAQLAEDQALLKRQLLRLKTTMEVLATRFEGEGRTHAAKLLRDGLKHLDERAAELGSKTVEELMAAATVALESGRSVQSVESQEAVVKSLEKLYAILTDRAGLEDLQKSLEELKQIQAGLTELANREQKLREATAALREKAATPEQKALKAALEQAIAEQRELMQRTEKDARSQEGLALGEIQRALERLQKQQEVDAGVLSSWKPEEQGAFEEARPSLDQAAEEATRAERLAEAASELRAAARKTRAPSTDLATVQRELERAAEREDRHQRASGDPAAKKAAEALAKGAESVQKSAPDAEARGATASDLEARAQELEAAAREAAASAEKARESAQKALDKLADPESAAGQAAQAAKSALEDAAKAGNKAKAAAAAASGEKRPDGTQPTAAEAERAAADAERALAEAERATAAAQQAAQKALEEQKTIRPALASSQAAAAEESKKLAAEVAGLPEGQTSAAQEAKSALESAATAQKSASQSAEKSDAKAAAKSAAEARQALEKAKAAVDALATEKAAQRAQSPEAKALEALQRELEKKAEAMGEQASKSGLSPASQSAAEKALAGAQEAMKDAAQKLSQGQSAQASGAQSEALEKMAEAAKAANEGSSQARPEDKQETEAQAAEQEKIRAALLELAQRNQKRKTAQPSPSLERAQASAGEAKEELEEGDLDDAEKKEQETEREMREALSELGKEEEQYQKLRQEELLFKMAEQVRTLIDEHRVAMKDTLEIDKQRRPGEKATHTQRLRLRKIGQTEEALGGRAGEIGRAILAEQSIVFAELLDEARKDLTRIARDMGDAGEYQSGERVQTLQIDVEQSLGWLQEALAAEKERRREEEQKGSDEEKKKKKKDPGANRLVPDVAELKLLRRMEVDILDSVDQIRALHPEIAEAKDQSALDPLLLEDIGRLAVRHERTSDLFQKFRKRLGIPDPEPKKDDQ